jgi:N-acetyl-gamma-glutamyl-phosphate reductase
MKIAIIGASGYAGGELIRLLFHHSAAEVTCATSRKLAGTPVDQVHPHLKGFTELKFENPDTGSIDADVAFLAVPHTAAMLHAGKLLSRGIKVVDLSADYRLPKDIYETVYGVEHSDYFVAPYGIPELHRGVSMELRSIGCFGRAAL